MALEAEQEKHAGRHPAPRHDDVIKGQDSSSKELEVMSQGGMVSDAELRLARAGVMGEDYLSGRQGERRGGERRGKERRGGEGRGERDGKKEKERGRKMERKRKKEGERQRGKRGPTAPSVEIRCSGGLGKIMATTGVFNRGASREGIKEVINTRPEGVKEASSSPS